MSEPSSATNACPKCGAALPSEATAGLCPRCLMAEAMSPTKPDAEPVESRKPLSPLELAPHFPQLEVLEYLGRGGMGVVYKARQKNLNRVVALKLLAPERVGDPQFAERFTHEARALAAMNHPNIVTVYDFGQAGGFYYLLMEFVDGVNLRQAMKAARFTPEQALAIVPPVCEALQYAHEHGIVHRDIKPENLLLDKEGRVKIADFGIAKMLGGNGGLLTRPSDSLSPAGGEGRGEGKAATQLSAAGTPQYMAPEQKAHRVTDHRADIYSLGVVLYELLTGELPGRPIEPPSHKVQIDVRLDEIVLRALEREPERRYQQVSEVKTMVETVTGTPSTSASAATAKTAGPAAIDDIRRQVKAPAIGLFVSGILNMVLAAFFATGMAYQPANEMSLFGFLGMIVIVSFLLGGVMVIGSLKMKRLEGYGYAIAAAILAVLFPPSCVGLPLGIWALVVLGRTEVRQAFRKGSSRVLVVLGNLALILLVGVFVIPPILIFLRATSQSTAPAFAQEPSSTMLKLPASLGHGIGSAFLEIPQPQLLLVGFKVSFGEEKDRNVVKSLQPIYRAGKKRFLGAVQGEVQERTQTVEAKSGYAVGGLNGMGIVHLNGFEIEFMKIQGTGGGLDIHDAYKSDWLGGKNRVGGVVELAATGKPIVGVFGRSDTVIRALGLVEAGSVFEPGSADAHMMSAAAWPKAIQLLPLIDPTRDAILGRWRNRDGALVCADNIQAARLQIPYEPPEEYDFRIVFTRTEGEEPVGQLFSQDDKPALWVMGHWGNSCFGFEMVQNRSANNNSLTVWTPHCLINNRVYSSVLQVRKNGVRAFLDGRMINEWKTDFSDAGRQKLWKLRNERALGLVSDRAVTVFHSIDVLEITGKGKPLRQSSTLAMTSQRPEVEFAKVMLAKGDIVSIPASSDQAYVIGPLPAGSVIYLQYVEGKWKSWGNIATACPDDPLDYGGDNKGGNRNRLAVVEATRTGPQRVLAVVPPNTQEAPFLHVLNHDTENVVLRINSNDDLSNNPGVVKYRLYVQKPSAPKTVPLPQVSVYRVDSGQSKGPAAADPTRTTMHALAARVANGDSKALEQFVAAGDGLRRDAGDNPSHLAVCNSVQREAVAFIGSQAGKGNRKAFEALKKLLAFRTYNGFAAGALADIGAEGNDEALDIVLNYKDWGIYESTALFTLDTPAAKNNPKVVAFLSKFMDDPTHRDVWHIAAMSLAAAGSDKAVDYLINCAEHPTTLMPWSYTCKGLAAAAAKGNAKAQAALEKYSKINDPVSLTPRREQKGQAR